MNKRAAHPALRWSGFTLLELLVAMAVGLAVIRSALLVFQVLSRQWQTNSALVRNRAEARMALDWLRRDLESAMRAAPRIGSISSPRRSRRAAPRLPTNSISSPRRSIAPPPGMSGRLVMRGRTPILSWPRGRTRAAGCIASG